MNGDWAGGLVGSNRCLVVCRVLTGDDWYWVVTGVQRWLVSGDDWCIEVTGGD